MDTTASTSLAFDPRCKQHDTGPGHPEQPARLDAISTRLERDGLLGRLAHLEVRTATTAELARCHESGYITLVEREVAAGRSELSTGDTVISKASFDVARLAAGAALMAIDAVMTGAARNAFCFARPPGHHASAARGMGFCLFNNVALAARHAQQQHRAGKVAIVDWDVHHGNGTQDIFYEDPSVFFFSTHQHPWYPGTGRRTETGRGPGLGTTLNVPLPAGSGRAEILGAMEKDLIPALERFEPDLVLISAGFDSREGDPLGQFRLTDEDFVDMTGLVREFAVEHCGGRLVSVLEGGYNLNGLASAVSSHVRTLAEA